MGPVRWFLGIAAFAFVSLTYAHENAPAGPNGGEVRDAGEYHLELVAKDGKLALYVTDEKDKKVPTQGAAATATILSGKDKANIKLQPASENALTGASGIQFGRDTKVVVSLTLPGQAPLQARFTPLADAKPAQKPAGK